MELTGFVIMCVLMHAPQHAMSQENVTFPEEPDRGVLDPDLMDVKPPLVVSAPLVSEPVDLSTPSEATNLRWVTAYQQTKGNAGNALPPDVVCVHNNYTSRQECVCRPRGVCALGFMTPARGFYCYYSLRGHQLLTADFQLLQNRRNFERLEWQAAENGSVPEHGIKHCRHNYVGRNRYGLGNVHAEMGVLYLPWEGREYWYRDYEVLTVNRDKYHLQVFKMSYDTKKMNVSTLPEVELMESKCMPNLNRTSELITEVYMQTKHEKLNQWEPTLIMPHMLSINFSVKVPEVVLGKDVSASPNTPSDLTEWSGLKLRQNVSLTTHHSAAITPGHCCRVTMLGRKMEVAMPFWAQVRKVYLSGATHAASIVGTYRSTEMGGIKGEPGRCDPLEEEKKEEEKKEVPAERTKPLEATKPPQNPGGGTSAVFPGLSFYASLALCLAVVGVVV